AIRARFGLAEFDRPARVAILVPQLGRLGLPLRRYTVLLDRLLLVVRIALTRRRNQAGIDDLTRHSEVTSLPQHGIELLEQSLDRPGRGQLLAEQPDRAGSGTRSCNPSPRNRINDRRSLMRNSARSSERLLVAWMTKILNISTGSKGGRPPSVRSA